MLFSYNWLKEYIENLPEAKALAERLTMIGTEVESVAEAGGGISNVITVQVMSCDKHPNADRLQVCEVRTETEKFLIVCGARNMKPGDIVPLAQNGAELPGGLKIKKSKIRGVESQGMMCSEVELGIKEASEGLMILPQDTPLGVDINQVLNLKDYLMEVGITPNRADLLSIRGLAREISAVTGAALKGKAIKVEESEKETDELATVSIENEAPCRTYTARVIEGVTIGPSSENIKKRLEAHGIRSINNVVDVTNLVLLELGQPLHAFDLDKVEGKAIDVRLAGEGETIDTLDGKQRLLDSSMLVIADAKGPVAVAGVMGGGRTEVSETTKNVLLESAWFEPSTVRRTSKKLGLSTDSSYRFERGVDFNSVKTALDMAAYLIEKLAGGKAAKGVLEVTTTPVTQEPIRFRVERASKILGVRLAQSDIKEIFGRLGLTVTAEEDGVLTVVPPSYRGDLKEETDLVEEAARIFGYDNIPTTLPKAELAEGRPGKHTMVRRIIQEVLVNAGFLEVVNYSFVSRELYNMLGPSDKTGITIMNPLSEDQIVMRDSLMPTLLETLKKNLLKKNEEVNIFELGPVFLPGDKLPNERWTLGCLMYGTRYGQAWNTPKDWVDFFDMKGVVEKLLERLGVTDVEFVPAEHKLFHHGKTAEVIVKGKMAGIFGELHPDICQAYDLRRPAYLFEADIDTVTEAAGAKKAYRSLPKFPESARDIAFIIDEKAPYSEIISLIERLDRKLIETVELFDVYYGGNIPQGKKSMAIRVTYRASDRTLTAEEVEAKHQAVSALLTEKFGAEIRGEAK